MKFNDLLNFNAVVNDATTDGFNFVIVIMIIIIIILIAIFMFSHND